MPNSYFQFSGRGRARGHPVARSKVTVGETSFKKVLSGVKAPYEDAERIAYSEVERTDSATKARVVRFHQTDILAKLKDGRIVVNTAGWRTNVTHRHILDALKRHGMKVDQVVSAGRGKGTRIVTKTGVNHDFMVHLLIRPDGSALADTPEGEAILKALQDGGDVPAGATPEWRVSEVLASDGQVPPPQDFMRYGVIVRGSDGEVVALVRDTEAASLVSKAPAVQAMLREGLEAVKEVRQGSKARAVMDEWAKRAFEVLPQEPKTPVEEVEDLLAKVDETKMSPELMAAIRKMIEAGKAA